MRDDERASALGDLEMGSSSSSRISDDRIFRALASKQRRRLLSYLLDGEVRTVEELATALTGWQASESGSMQTAADREQVRIELFHSHLPLLDEVGLIAYDRDRDVVRIESLDPVVEELLAGRFSTESPQ
ncbi:hypothetical protein L593_02425 [Salinarchaeum sp. Harcht-Bsk1]|uniref:DUF7344 domain-containing protein n=1 Tax=Salinarchaeum sp. Harcht-Bsk1 TaxID=1333523 RepID=UPI00034248B1|nr:helix-turn-helix domain-containing protein [Salinarchaeum sp. Harcht-Bsk1]AGN00436.1 hypothetical protein L593_02425 [Salinarchaeum sp. Harcht-Bsk1]